MRKFIFKIWFAFLLLFSPFYAGADHCEVAQINIIAGPWENVDGKTSLTLQAQDSGGEICHTPQTLRFSLESSAGGSFTSQSGNALQFFISSGSANRNFYYVSEMENFILIAKAGYGTADGWSEEFAITYDEESVGKDHDDTNESAVDTVSAHFSSTAVSSSKPTSKATLSIGKNRLGSVGSPMEFAIDTSLKSLRKEDYRWNFGDGTVKQGLRITHTYEYPGEYVVMLNAESGGERAAARINVKVIEADLQIIEADKERIIIQNNSKNEINLYGRVLLVSDKIFVFPRDTLVGAGQNISFSFKVTGLTPTDKNDVKILAVGEDSTVSNVTQAAHKMARFEVEKVYTELGKIEEMLAMRDAERLAHAQNHLMKIEEETLGDSSELVNLDAQTASVLQSAVSTEEGDGWFAALKRFFLRTEK